jgi:hypothetical protein
MSFLIVAGTGFICYFAGVLTIGLVAGNRHSAELEEAYRICRDRLKENDRINAEDVARLMAEHRKRIISEAAALHKRECRNIRKGGKQRGAITGANA